MQVTLIHNPTAGGGQPDAATLRNAFADAGWRVRYINSKTTELDELHGEGADLVAVAGGDGTVSKVIHRLAGSRTPIAVLPLGTANNLAGALRLPRVEPLASIPHLRDAPRCTLRLGAVRGPWGRSSFLESAGVGLFTRLFAAADLPHLRELLSDTSKRREFDKIRQLLHGLAAGSEPEPYTVTLDGETLTGEFLAVEVMNVPAIGPRLILAPDADPCDELLDVVLVRASERATLVRYVTTWRDHRGDPPRWEVHRARRATIAGPSLVAHADDRLQPEPDEEGEPLEFAGEISAALEGSVEVLRPEM